MFYLYIGIAIVVSAVLCNAYNQSMEEDENPSKFKRFLRDIWGLIATAGVALLVVYSIRCAMLLFIKAF